MTLNLRPGPQGTAVIDWRTSTSGLDRPLDQVLSAIGKSLRYSQGLDASHHAVDYFHAAPMDDVPGQEALARVFWDWLSDFAIEDCVGGITLLPMLEACRFTSPAKQRGPDRHLLYVFAAIEHLAAAHHGRGLADRLHVALAEYFEYGIARPEWPPIPDRAIDMHTAAGRAMGRGVGHYVAEASTSDGFYRPPDGLADVLRAGPSDRRVVVPFDHRARVLRQRQGPP